MNEKSVNNDDYTFVIRPWNPEFKGFYDNLKKVWKEKWNFPEMLDSEDLMAHYPTFYDTIPDQISHAAYVVADISLGLPNVYWEYGYALALGKPILLFYKDKSKLKEKFKKYVEVALPSCNALDINRVIARHFTIASDIAGVIYYDYTNLDLSDASSLQTLKKRAKSALECVYRREQISILRQFQFEQYLQLGKGKMTCYCLYDDHIKSFKTLEKLLQKMKENGREVGRIIFHFCVKPLDYDQFRRLFSQDFEVGITPIELSWKYMLIDNDLGYFSPDGEKTIFFRHRSLKESISRLRSYLLDSTVSTASHEIFIHAVQMQKQFGFEDAHTLRNDGFAFDEHSKLWIVGPREVLSYIAQPDGVENLCNKIQRQITNHFAKFARDYLSETEYIVAFWPLNEESFSFVLGPQEAEQADNPVKWWLKELNDWVEKKHKPEEREHPPIDRFLVIPANKGKLYDGKYELTDASYKKRVVDFFHKGFEWDECKYQDRVFVTFDLPEVVNAIFTTKNPEILRQNAILFSKDKLKSQDLSEPFSGILQFETSVPVVGSKASSTSSDGPRILNLRYRKLPKEIPPDSDVAARLANQIIEIRKALNSKTKALRHDCLAIITAKKFLSDNQIVQNS